MFVPIVLEYHYRMIDSGLLFNVFSIPKLYLIVAKALFAAVVTAPAIDTLK
jgi:hypothetical protein